jgi:hypothetical protein
MFKSTIFRFIFPKCFKLPKIKILIHNYLKALLFRYSHLLKDTIKHATGMYEIAASVLSVQWSDTKPCKKVYPVEVDLLLMNGLQV